MSDIELPNATTRSQIAARKSLQWEARLASQKRPHKQPIPKIAPQATIAAHMIRLYYVGQTLSKEAISAQMTARQYQIWRSHYWRKIAPMAVHLPLETRAFDLDLASYFLPQEQESESDPQVFALPELTFIGRRYSGLNVYQAIWLPVSECAKSIGQQDLKGWILGGTVAAIAWILGGFTALIISAIALAVLSSIVSIFTDIKEGQFSATRCLAALGQFPVFMAFIALGRFADYGIGDDRIIIMRSLMVAIVIAVCFWRSFRDLVLMADLEGLDELIDREVDAFWDWVSARKQRRRASRES